jgi:LysR family transcriptional regulator, flagellar master operon regulator
LDIDLLKTFLELNRSRHFGRAAENLCISQSAVSARIKLLEDNIGAALFTRDRNNIQLTAVGEKLVRHADSIVMAWGRIKQDVILKGELKNFLVVAGVPSLWDIFLQNWLSKMVSAFSSTAIHAEVLSQEQMLRQLLDGTVDLGFGFESPQLNQLQVEEVMKFELILVSSIEGLLVNEAISDNYILVNWGTSFAISHIRHFPDAPAPRLRVGVGRLAHEYLLQQGGSAYIAEPMVRTDIASKRLYRVDDAPVIHRTAYAIHNAQDDKLAMINRAIKLAKSF